MVHSNDNPIEQQLQLRGIAVFSHLDNLSWLSWPHRLETLLMAVCVRGNISATIDLKTRSMEHDTIMVLRPGHTINDIQTSDDFTGIFFIAGIDKLAALIPLMTRLMPCALYYAANPVINVTSAEIQTMCNLYSMLETKMSDDSSPYHQQIISSVVELIFYETLSIYTTHMKTPLEKPTRAQQLMSGFMELVETNFRKERTVLFYARELCVSPKHLSTVIKEISGLTAGDWIDNSVILEAKLLLRNSSMSIQEISNVLSFPNQSFFGKYFKHHTGFSPREFRANPAVV